MGNAKSKYTKRDYSTEKGHNYRHGLNTTGHPSAAQTRDPPLPKHDYGTPVDHIKSKVSKPKRVHEENQRDDLRFRNIYVRPLDVGGDYTPPIYPKTSEETKLIHDAIQENFIFSGLGEEEVNTLVDAMELYPIKTGTTIIAQGSSVGDYFYVVKKGKVQFYVDGQSVGIGGERATFGELSLLYNCPRTATCIAKTECELWRVGQVVFRKTLAAFQIKNDELKTGILSKVDIFKDLNDTELKTIADTVTEMGYKEGDKIVQKGTLGEAFYIVRTGTVLVTDIGLGTSVYLDQVLGPGEFFGERALITGDVRAANITAKSDCILYCMSRDDFLRILGPYQELIEKKKNRNRLLQVPMISKSNIKAEEMDSLLELVQDISFKKDYTIYETNQMIKPSIFMITSGKVTLTHKDGTYKVLTHNDYFGEETFRKGKLEVMSEYMAKANEETSCAVLDLSSIQLVLHNVSLLITGKSVKQAERDSLTSALTLDTINKIRVLGEGTFGQVWLCSDVRTKEPYALKIQSKKWLLEKGQDRGVMREKSIMAMIDHPFVVKLLNAFQDERYLYMITKIYLGGELFHLMRETKHIGMSERRGKFYTACIFEGLSFMHSKKVCYRDLKPENVLLDSEGYCVLIDLGFAKVVTSKTYTLCGTPLYIAPEIILQRGHNKSADIWSLGVMIYELIIGKTPFYSRGIDQATLFKRICRANYSVEGKCSPEAEDLIKKMLRLTPHDRIGCLAAGADDIRNHNWYKGVDFDFLVGKKFKAPWVPSLKHNLDCEYFEEYSKLERDHDDDLPLTAAEQKHFIGF